MSLPGRVVECEDRTTALEQHVVAKLDEMRAELASLRQMVESQLDADADATELVGRLLQLHEARLAMIEQDALAPGRADEDAPEGLPAG